MTLSPRAPANAAQCTGMSGSATPATLRLRSPSTSKKRITLSKPAVISKRPSWWNCSACTTARDGSEALPSRSRVTSTRCAGSRPAPADLGVSTTGAVVASSAEIRSSPPSAAVDALTRAHAGAGRRVLKRSRSRASKVAAVSKSSDAECRSLRRRFTLASETSGASSSSTHAAEGAVGLSSSPSASAAAGRSAAAPGAATPPPVPKR